LKKVDEEKRLKKVEWLMKIEEAALGLIRLK
jgi:hypothetical protein